MMTILTKIDNDYNGNNVIDDNSDNNNKNTNMNNIDNENKGKYINIVYNVIIVTMIYEML